MQRALVITGTDTAAGKTALMTLLLRSARARGIDAVALKPICSGGRDDARRIAAAMDGTWSLDEINPWHFRAPIAPALAARRENKTVTLSQVVTHVRRIQKRSGLVIVEGAGGLLSPLGKDFDSRDLISRLRATPVIVGWNKLGVINQLRLTLEALPNDARTRARIVLMTPKRPDAATRSNIGLLAEFFDRRKTVSLPWLGDKPSLDRAFKISAVRNALRAILAG